MPGLKDPIKHKLWREAIAATMKQRLSNPKTKSEHVARMAAAVHTSEARAKRAATSRLQWQDPAFRNKRIKILNSPETKERQRTAGKRRYEDPEHKEAMAVATRAAMQRPDVQQKISKGGRRAWGDPVISARLRSRLKSQEHRQNTGNKLRERLADPVWKAKWLAATAPGSSERLKRLCQDPEFQRRRVEGLALVSEGIPSSLERAVQSVLDSLGVLYVAQKPYGPYFVDFYIPEGRVVLECDGAYWHSSKEQVAHDRRRDMWFEEQGCRVVRLSDAQIIRDANAAVTQALSSLGVLSRAA